MREEFGDLLLQIVLQSQIASEEGQFNVNQVVQGIHSKIVRRHPHVFGELELDGVEGVLLNWEKLKMFWHNIQIFAIELFWFGKMYRETNA